MLLDRPGKFLYRHHVNTYRLMRLFCTPYRCIVCVGVFAVIAVLSAWLTRPELLARLGIIVPAR